MLEDGTEIVIDTSMAELINSFGIVTAINDNGWKSWGNNTAAYPGTTDPRDRWINCRRMMNWYRNHFILTYKNKVDDNTNYRLIESVIDSENQYLNGLAPDKLAGGSISFNEDENPIQSILDGNIVFLSLIHISATLQDALHGGADCDIGNQDKSDKCHRRWIEIKKSAGPGDSGIIP